MLFARCNNPRCGEVVYASGNRIDRGVILVTSKALEAEVDKLKKRLKG